MANGEIKEALGGLGKNALSTLGEMVNTVGDNFQNQADNASQKIRENDAKVNMAIVEQAAKNEQREKVIDLISDIAYVAVGLVGLYVLATVLIRVKKSLV